MDTATLVAEHQPDHNPPGPRAPLATVARYAPSPTCQSFILSAANGPREEMRLLLLQAPRGEGKTTAGIYASLAVAERLRVENLEVLLPVKVAVVRDTWVNLNRPVCVDSMVLTETGWVKAGDVEVGDWIIALDGTPTRVEGVYPRPSEPLWRISFSDETSARATKDHLWGLQGRWDREQPGIRNRRCRRDGWLPGYGGLRIATTEQIKDRLARSRRRQKTWSVPLVDPVQFPHRDVPLDPYVLGVLLGDGGFSGGSVIFTTADLEIIDLIRPRLPEGVSIDRKPRTKYDYTIRGQGRGRTHPLKEALVDLGLWGNRSPQKFIPERYLWNDPATRLAVLRGLMDTDGCAGRDRHISFSSTSERLIEGVEFLVRSLGGLTHRTLRTFAPDEGHWLRDHWVGHRHPAWTLSIQMPAGVNPFMLSRKAERIDPRRRVPYRWITSVEPDGDGPSVCFKVAHPSGLFVINDFIVTHNTTIASFEENQQRGLPVQWLDGKHEAIISFDGQPYVHFYFFGMDNRQDADKLQGFQCGILWLEEVAAAAELTSGIPPETLGIGATSLRQSGVPRRLLVTFNPPDEEHWILQAEEYLAKLGLEDMVVHRFEIPSGEKSEHFRKQAQIAASAEEREMWGAAAREFDSYRRINEHFLMAIGRVDLVNRLVHGAVGGVITGEVLVPEFRKAHLVQTWMAPVMGVEIIRGWDGGHTPSCVWLQKLDNENVNILGSRMGRAKSMGSFIIEQVMPFQAKYGLSKPSSKFEGGIKRGFKFRDIGDPALNHPNVQLKSMETAKWVIEGLLQTSMESGPQGWDARRQALKTAFYRPGTGEDRAKLVNIYHPECQTLVQSLRNKARFSIDKKSGRIIDSAESVKKASGVFFQELDSLAYILAVVLPAEDWLRLRMSTQAPRVRRRAKTWLGR